MKIFFLLTFVIAIAIFSVYGIESAKKPVSSDLSVYKIDSTNNKKIKLNKGIGIGPVKKVRFGKIDSGLVKEGQSLFEDKCSACHSLDEEVDGPALRQVTKKLRPEYIMNYLLNTSEMQKKDKQLMELIKKYNGEAMPDLDLKEPQARAVVEYLRSAAK